MDGSIETATFWDVIVPYVPSAQQYAMEPGPMVSPTPVPAGEPEDTISQPGADDGWSSMIEPICARLDIAAKFDQEFVYNAKGAAAVALLMRTMAGKLDAAVSLLASKGARIGELERENFTLAAGSRRRG